MVKYRKKRYARRFRKRLRKRRGIRRRRVVRRGRRNRLHHFRRTITGSITATPGVLAPTGFSFSLDAVTNYSEFSNLFDSYRINKVVVKFVPRTTDNGQGANERGNFYTVVDYNDITTLTNVANALERDTVRRTAATRVHTRVFRPAVATAAYKSLTTWGYMPSWKRWIDMSDPQVPHYGLKYVIDNRDDVNMVYDYFITYYMSFMNVR